MFARTIRASAIRRYATVQAAAAPVVTKPRKVGSFRGGVVGFLLGSVVAGSLSYSYIISATSNAQAVVVADVVALQNSIDNLEKHIKALEADKKK